MVAAALTVPTASKGIVTTIELGSARRIRKAVFGSPQLLTLRCTQRPVVKLALLMEGRAGVRALFKAIALLVQEAFAPDAQDISNAMGALSLLGMVCNQNALDIERRVEAASPHATPATSQSEDYLFDLVLAQTKAKDVLMQKEASVSRAGDGFLGCFTDMLEAIATDDDAPVALRVQALDTICEYCLCSPRLTSEWVPKLMAMVSVDGLGERGDVDHLPGHAESSQLSIRLAAIRFWARVGPLEQEELVMTTYVKDDPDANVRQAAASAIFDMVLSQKVRVLLGPM